MSGWTYFIWAEGTELVKIGSTSDPQKRLKQLQTASPHRLVLLGSTPGADGERRFHERLKHLHKQGEWYEAYSVLKLMLPAMLANDMIPDSERPGLRIVK